MEISECMSILGAGDAEAGRLLLDCICSYLVVARHKHPLDMQNRDKAVQAVADEAKEFQCAAKDTADVAVMMHRTRDEALDVIVTAVRYINCEYVPESRHAGSGN